jgi:hypothetical protein
MHTPGVLRNGPSGRFRMGLIADQVGRTGDGHPARALVAVLVERCEDHARTTTRVRLRWMPSYDPVVPRVVGVEPIFVVSDVARAVTHFERLGFTSSYHDEGYAFAHRNELTIHLAGPGVDPRRVGRGVIYMHVDDADALADEWRDAGIEFVEPQDFDYGKREGSYQDPDGNLIRFGSPLRR